MYPFCVLLYSLVVVTGKGSARSTGRIVSAVQLAPAIVGKREIMLHQFFRDLRERLGSVIGLDDRGAVSGGDSQLGTPLQTQQAIPKPTHAIAATTNQTLPCLSGSVGPFS